MSMENEPLADELEQDLAPESVDEDFEVVVDESEDEPADGVQGEDTEEPDEITEEAAPEEVTPEESATEEEHDTELDAMPEKIKKRFAREKRLRDTIIQEREQIKSAAIQVAQLAKQREDEVLTLKKQNAALQRQFAETLDYAYEKDIASKAQELRRAREDGNYDAELKAQSELDTLRFQHNQVRQAKTTLPDPEKMTAPEPVQQPAPQQQAPQQPQGQRPPPSPLAVKWLNNNKAWFNSPKFQDHRDATLRVDARLKAEGYDPKSKDYYDELDRRVDALFPTLRKKPKGTGSPVAPAGNTPATSRSKNTITLTKSDLANMRRFGLDPSNKEQLREYALNKRA